MKIQMIATDMDGTLLHSDGTVSEETVKTIQAAQRAGVIFAVCTGRFPEHAGILLSKFGISCPLVGVNGGILWDMEKDEMLLKHYFEGDAAARAIEILHRNHLVYHIYGEKWIVSSHAEFRHAAEIDFSKELDARYHIRFSSGDDAVMQIRHMPISKMYISLRHGEVLHEEQRQELEQIPGLALTSSGKYNVEIMPAGVTKASGVQEMAALHGIAMEHVMTVGDYDNDIPMLHAAGWGVAMGNAPARVQQEANCVTLLNNEDGLAKAIQKYALNCC